MRRSQHGAWGPRARITGPLGVRARSREEQARVLPRSKCSRFLRDRAEALSPVPGVGLPLFVQLTRQLEDDNKKLIRRRP